MRVKEIEIEGDLQKVKAKGRKLKYAFERIMTHIFYFKSGLTDL